jgi:hypothetical protein
MADHDCAARGHHFHEADGAIFNRVHDRQTIVTNAKDAIAVHCCWCATAATKLGYGAQNAPTEPSTIACGEFVTL